MKSNERPLLVTARVSNVDRMVELATKVFAKKAKVLNDRLPMGGTVVNYFVAMSRVEGTESGFVYSDPLLKTVGGVENAKMIGKEVDSLLELIQLNCRERVITNP